MESNLCTNQSRTFHVAKTFMSQGRPGSSLSSRLRASNLVVNQLHFFWDLHSAAVWLADCFPAAVFLEDVHKSNRTVLSLETSCDQPPGSEERMQVPQRAFIGFALRSEQFGPCAGAIIRWSSPGGLDQEHTCTRWHLALANNQREIASYISE